MKKIIESIKGHIKSNDEASREIRKQIHAAEGMDRYRLWNDKRWQGCENRLWLLAYACLRGRSYVQIEQKVADGNEPSASGIFDIIQSSFVQDCPEKAEWTKDRVKAWLKRPEPSEVVSEAKEEAA